MRNKICFSIDPSCILHVYNHRSIAVNQHPLAEKNESGEVDQLSDFLDPRDTHEEYYIEIL